MSTEPSPLLSDEAISKMMGQLDGRHNELIRIRRFYEDLIASGELMVVKTVKGLMTNGDAWRRCSGCNIEYSPSSRWNFCPGCGAKISP